MRAEKLTITFRFEALSVQFALSGIQSVLRTLKTNLDGFHLDGKELQDLSDAAPRLRDRGRTNFDLTGNGFEFVLGRVRNCDFDFLLVRYRGDLEFPWDEWAKRFVGEATFVMARLADLEYDFWQNADDPLEYKARNRRFDHLAMKSNGLPYPLEQRITDTSGNPGRCILQRGYHEAVGSVMWLGEPFWQLTGARQSSLADLDWLQVSHPEPNVIRIQSAENCFSSPDGKDGETQRRLRKLIFPSAAP